MCIVLKELYSVTLYTKPHSFFGPSKSNPRTESLVEGGAARFTSVPLKPLSHQKCERYSDFSRLKSVKSYVFPTNVTFVGKP